VRLDLTHQPLATLQKRVHTVGGQVHLDIWEFMRPRMKFKTLAKRFSLQILFRSHFLERKYNSGKQPRKIPIHAKMPQYGLYIIHGCPTQYTEQRTNMKKIENNKTLAGRKISGDISLVFREKSLSGSFFIFNKKYIYEKSIKTQQT
jgi:hypothetical protein